MNPPHTESSDPDRNRVKDSTDDIAKSTASLASADTIPPNKQTVLDVDDASGEMFDHYRLVKKLGHGAMGTVYLAEDTKLRRQVALKRPRVASAEEAAVLQRFYREAYAAATLNHPNICPVYDLGEFNGIPYITMAYIEGRTLSQVIRSGKPLNPRAVAGLVRKLALALTEAHERGIVHRDLKPGNIMLNQRSEPIVMDFGLARQLDANVEDRLTSDGMLVGTLAYMSPEQVEGDLVRIGLATDIYSLGVVLFELLTGQLPFKGSAGSVIRQIATTDPVAPSSLRESVPEELEAICLRMMTKVTTARYASMSDVAQTLTDYLKSKGEPASMAAPPPVDEILPAQLEAQQKQIERLLDAGQWREASLHLQRMSELTQPVAAPFVQWAGEQATAMHIRWQQEQEAAARLLAEAKEDFKRHDYAGAAQRLVKIDKQLVTVESQQLLDESFKLAEEVDLLIHLIEQGLSGGSQAGAFRNMQRLLQLKPRDPLVRDLYRKFRWQQRLGWIGATLADAFALTGISRIRTTIEDPMYRQWFALAALVFLISFGLMSWHVAAYLRSSKQELADELGVAWAGPTNATSSDALADGGQSPTDAVAPTEMPPPGPYALELDLDDRVDVESLFYDGTHPVTMEAWVKLPATATGWNSPLAWFTQNYDGDGNRLSKGIYIFAACDSNHPDKDTWYIATNDTHRTTQAAVVTEKWAHIAVVVAGVELKFFLDGKLVHERDIPEPLLPPDKPFLIGEVDVVPESQRDEPTNRYWGYHDFFGQLDEIRVSKVARYTTDFTPELRFEPDADTLALFHCDEGSGDQLIDSSGNEHHGKVRNTVWIPSTDEHKKQDLGSIEVGLKSAVDPLLHDRVASRFSHTTANDRPLSLLSSPVLVLDGAGKRYEHTSLWVWTDGTRPTVLMAMTRYKSMWSYELSSIALENQQIAFRTDGFQWLPSTPAIQSTSLGVPKSESTDRLPAMREIAMRYSVSEGIRELRLSDNSLCRYSSPTHGVLDGALFSFTHEDDPELLLMVEFRQTAESPTPAWRVGIAPVTSASVRVNLDGREVWRREAVTKEKQQTPYTLWQEIDDPPKNAAKPSPSNRSLPATPRVTRKKHVVIKTSKEGGHRWHYSLATPPTGWQDPAGEDTWPARMSAFGTPGAHGTTVRTEWIHPNIYLRTKVYVPRFEGRKMVLRCAHDDWAEVYVNGTLLKRFDGYSGYFDYVLKSDQIYLFLQDTFNDVAVRCHQNNASFKKRDKSNPQVIDIGLRLE